MTWGIIGITAAIAATIWIGYMLYKNERDKERTKEMLCAVSGHDLDGCLCRRCGKEEHDWSRCICIRCGEKRDEQHDWEAESGGEIKICKICGKIDAPEYDEEDEEE